MRIGLSYVRGSLPALENFGNIPTDLVKSNGLINGNPISEELDALIIPGGSILESNSISDDFKKEILVMAKEGKVIIGICAGYQLLSNQLDTTNPNSIYSNKNPIKKGLSLLDVDFSYLFSNDKVEAKVVNNSFLTKGLDRIKGFHCHSYGGISGDSKTLFYSPLRVNYSERFTNIISGSINDDGNVIGTMIHNIFDDNPEIVNNLFEFLDGSSDDRLSVYKKNKILQYNMKKELAIDSNIPLNSSLYNIENPILKLKNNLNKSPKVLIISSTNSNSGKTFITTGIAGSLSEKGLNVGVLKLGSNIKDILPGLYLTKNNMETYSLINNKNNNFNLKSENEDIREKSDIKNNLYNNYENVGLIKDENSGLNDYCSDIFGWSDIPEVISKINNSSYDIVLIEGEKAILDNLTNNNYFSTIEIALSSNIPILLISSAEYGLDIAISDFIEHKKILSNLGVNINSVVFNRVLKEDFNSYDALISSFKNKLGINDVYKIPEVDFKELNFSYFNSKEYFEDIESNFENRYDIYSILAFKTIKNNLNLLKIFNLSKKVSFNKFYSLEELEFLNNFF